MAGGVSEESGTEMVAIMHELHIGFQNKRFGRKPISHFENNAVCSGQGRLVEPRNSWLVRCYFRPACIIQGRNSEIASRIWNRYPSHAAELMNHTLNLQDNRGGWSIDREPIVCRAAAHWPITGHTCQDVHTLEWGLSMGSTHTFRYTQWDTYL